MTFIVNELIMQSGQIYLRLGLVSLPLLCRFPAARGRENAAK